MKMVDVLVVSSKLLFERKKAVQHVVSKKRIIFSQFMKSGNVEKDDWLYWFD